VEEVCASGRRSAFERWVLDPGTEMDGVLFGCARGMLLGSATAIQRFHDKTLMWGVAMRATWRSAAASTSAWGAAGRLEIETTLGLLAARLPRLGSRRRRSVRWLPVRGFSRLLPRRDRRAAAQTVAAGRLMQRVPRAGEGPGVGLQAVEPSS
jgi:hypothetical protein